jgi:tetratricopeptide (TPR) repeat protein
MNPIPRCSTCDTPLTAGRCPRCDVQTERRHVYREIVLLVVLVAVTVAAFFVTRSVAATNREMRRQEAVAWFESAQQLLQAGRAAEAVAGLRRAAATDPDNKPYHLALASALAASQQEEEAERVLLALRELQPEDSETNLQLARLEARRARVDEARRHYQSAVAALWRPEQVEERRRVRTELIQLLLAHDERARALAELLALGANLPEDAATQVDVGRMFLDARDPSRALEHFLRALEQTPEHGNALAGAGEAAFLLGDYAAARRHLRAAPADDGRVAELLEVTELVLSHDPLAPRLTTRERLRRLTVGFEHASARLEACAERLGGDPSQTAHLDGIRAEASAFREMLAARRQPPDIIDDGFDLVYRIERSLEEACGAPAVPLDRALLLIGRRHELETQ